MTQRVVLVHAPPHGEVPFRPIGLGYLAAVLQAEGVDAILADVSAEEGRAGTDVYDDAILYLSERVGDVSDGLDPQVLMEVLHPEDFPQRLPLSDGVLRQVERHADRLAELGDVFLFSANIITYYAAAGLAQRLRQRGRKTAVGGPSVRFAPIRDLLLRCGAFDAAVVGEGEPVVTALVAGLRRGSVAGLPGVAWLDGDPVGGVVRAEPPAPPPDLHALPDPLFPREHVRDFVPILAARGCAARCSYCSEPFHWTLRRRTPEAVVAEMDRAAERYGCENFHFHDDTINEDLRWFDRFLALLEARGGRYRWESFCGPMGLDQERLHRMRRAGCVLLKMGVQSFSHDTLKRMRRLRHADRLKEAIVAAERAGISMHYDMLICFPGETEDDHRHNLRVVEEVFADARTVYFSLNPFYLSVGSEVHLRAERYGIQVRAFDPATLPPHLAAVVRAAGELPVGFRYDIPREVVLRRIKEMGEVLKRHGRDYLYLGQEEVPEGSGGFQAEPARGSVEAPVAPVFRELVRPWQPGEARGGWVLEAIRPVAGGEDGLVKYVFRAQTDAGRSDRTVSVRLAARNDARPCFVRTHHFNVFYDTAQAAADDTGSSAAGAAGPADELVRQGELVRKIVALVMRNEERLDAAREKARARATGERARAAADARRTDA